jgi:hypothetical protein
MHRGISVHKMGTSEQERHPDCCSHAVRERAHGLNSGADDYIIKCNRSRDDDENIIWLTLY